MAVDISTVELIQGNCPPWDMTVWPAVRCTLFTDIVVPRTRRATPVLAASANSGNPPSALSVMVSS